MKKSELRNIKVLLVDSDYDFLKVMSQFLQKEGFRVITAGDGEEGLNKALVEYPDLVILEPVLSKIHGLTLCSMITTEFKKKIPVIIVSKQPEGEHFRKEAIHAQGASAYLTRPITKNELRRVIFDILGNGKEEETKAAGEVLRHPDLIPESENEESGGEGPQINGGTGEDYSDTVPPGDQFFNFEMSATESSGSTSVPAVNNVHSDSSASDETHKMQNSSANRKSSLNSIRERLHSAIKQEEISSENYQERSTSRRTKDAEPPDDSNEEKEQEQSPVIALPNTAGNNGNDPAKLDKVDEMLTQIMMEFGMKPTKKNQG
ncbi:MAG: response regulator transcription factor [Candidatus Aminicenantes bacterium]|nr:response regulator transcription factor [Candidatus Aminicenantes bacterium]